MSHTRATQRTARRPGLTSATTTALVLLTAGLVTAHVEVDSDKAQVLARNVRIRSEAESEPETAGITELRVVQPAGIPPASVTYGEGPTGWKPAVKTLRTNDDGRTHHWTEPEDSGGNPAPIRELTAAASPSPRSRANGVHHDDGGSDRVLAGLLAAILVAIAAVTFAVRRREATGQ